MDIHVDTSRDSSCEEVAKELPRFEVAERPATNGE
jgi:hypothetical protein